MVFGFGKKQIEVIIEKYNFSLGESIKGTIKLALNKPTHAKALKVGLIGERLTNTTRVQGGKVRPEQKKEHVFNFEMPLDGEKEYLQGEYNFEIKIPTNLSQNLPGGLTGDVLKTIQIIAGNKSNVYWYVIAKLDIAMGIDVSKKVQVNIG
jgi:hypothetical protein